MATNKRQHFVPQFLLRRFGNIDKKSINLFNLRSKRHIQNAPIKSQSFRNWYYGQNLRTEQTFALLEGHIAETLRAISDTGRPPPRDSVPYRDLIRFIAIQKERTVAANDHSNEQFNKLGKAVLTHTIKDPKIKELLPSVTFSRTDAVSESIRQAILGSPYLYDLRLKILKNFSASDFFLSDAPVAFHNTLFEDHEAGPFVGYANTGLQIVLPIDPRSALLFYDENAYDVGSKTSNIIKVVNAAHIRLINDLQWESASENVYLSPNTTAENVLNDATRCLALRPGESAKVIETLIKGRLVLTLTRPPSAIRLELPFIRTKIKIDLANPNLHIRNPEQARFIDGARGALEAGSLSFEQFARATNF